MKLTVGIKSKRALAVVAYLQYDYLYGKLRYYDVAMEAVLEKYMLIESTVTVLLRNYCDIKLRNIAGEPTAPFGKEVLMSALLTFCFGKYYSRKPLDT